MLLARGRYWQASLRKGSEALALSLQRDALPEDLQELKDLRIEVPFARWNGVVKRARSDRKLLGGLLLDYARSKDQLAIALADDRLYGELRGVVIEASAALVEEGLLALAPPESAEPRPAGS